MQLAENGFKKHQLIPFYKTKIPRAIAASLTSREEKLSSTILSFNEKKIRSMYPPHQRFYGKQ